MIFFKKHLLIVSLATFVFSCAQEPQELTIEQRAQEIVDQVQLPVIPNREVSVVDYGAIADGKSDNTEVFKKAIAELSNLGGGKLVVPKGQYLTGPIHLKSHIELHLSEGSEILFKTDPEAYMPMVKTSYEGIELYNFSPLIYAYQAENIAVTGTGILNGQGRNISLVALGWKRSIRI